jgi:hypothetical protein
MSQREVHTLRFCASHTFNTATVSGAHGTTTTGPGLPNSVHCQDLTSDCGSKRSPSSKLHLTFNHEKLLPSFGGRTVRSIRGAVQCQQYHREPVHRGTIVVTVDDSDYVSDIPCGSLVGRSRGNLSPQPCRTPHERSAGVLREQ